MATRGKDQICAVKACGDGILLETLRYEKEVRDSDSVFSHIGHMRVDKEMMSLASELIKRKTAPFKPEKFKSHYAAALKELIEEKRKKGKVSPATDEKLEDNGRSNVIDLMEALRKSVKGGERATPRKPARKSGPRPRNSARKVASRRKKAE
jgi:DNA end-binding protein Ku